MVKNAAWNFGSQVWNQMLYLVVTPILLKTFGLNRFGFFALYLSMTALCIVLDFGLPVAMIRFIAAENKDGGPRGANPFSMALVGGAFTLLFGFLAALFGWVFVGDLIDWWQPDVDDVEILASVLEIGCLLFLFTYLSNFLSGILKGLGRYDITSKVWSVAVTAQAAFVFAAVGMKASLTGVALAHAAGAGAHCVILLVVSARFVWPLRQRKIAVARHLREMVRLVRYGVPVQVSTMLGQFERFFAKYFLLHFAGLAYVSLLEIAQRVILSIFFLLFKLYEVLLPEAAALWALGDTEALANLHMKASRLLAFLTFMLYGAVFVGAPPFFELWLSGPKPELVWMLRVLLVGGAIGLTNGVTSICAMGIGKTAFPLYASAIKVALMLGASFCFSSTNPVGGYCIGSTVGAVAGALFLAAAYHREVAKPVGAYLTRGILPPLAAAAIPCAALALLLGPTGAVFHWIEPSRLRALVDVFAVCAAFAVAYVLINWLTGNIKRADLSEFKRIFSGRRDRSSA